MTPEVKRQWVDTLARYRAEKAAYAKRAAAKRKEAIELRKRRRFLDALIADSRAAEYRRTRDQYAQEARDVAAKLKGSR
jgi:hypothetical protein